MALRGWLGMVMVLALAGVSQAEDGPPDAADLRAAVARSLPYLEREGVAWMKGRGCMSCHYFSFTIWSHHEAAKRGIPVDQAKLSEWTGWAKQESLKKREWFKLTEQALQSVAKEEVPAEIVEKLQPLKDKPFVTQQALIDALTAALPAEAVNAHQELLVKQAAQPKSAKNDGGGLDTVYQLILAQPAATSGAIDEPWQNELANLVRKWQEPDGAWKAAGQLPAQKRPAAESNDVTSGWALIALASLNLSDPESRKCLDTALARRKDVKPGKSLESLLVCYLIEQKHGTPAQASALLEQVRQRQNADGGWSWSLHRAGAAISADYAGRRRRLAGPSQEHQLFDRSGPRETAGADLSLLGHGLGGHRHLPHFVR